MNPDHEEDLGWRDPAVIVGAVALVALILWALIWAITGHNLLQGSGQSGTTPISRTVVPSGSAAPSGVNQSGLPYRNCAAAARDGRYNIHIGDPAYNPALDRDRDGIACKRR